MRKKTKIALIQLPYYKSISVNIPLGLIMLGTVAEQNGFRAEIVDLDFLIKKGSIDTTSKFFKAAAKEILRSDADILGFSPLCHSFPAALLVAKECKKLAPEKMIFFGGPEAGFQDTETLRRFHFVDLIVRGEGEKVLVEVLEAIQAKKSFNGIRGITYRKQNKIVKNPDQELICNLDTLPYPDFSLHPVFRSKEKLRYKVESIPVEGGRGCPYSCTFCSTRQTWRQHFRLKSPRRLVNEIKHIRDNISKNIPVEIIHDNLSVNRKALLQFCQYLPKGITWRLCARIDLLDKAVIQKLSQSGCAGMLIGIESGSPRIQRIIRKNIDLGQAYKNILLINKSGMEPRYSFITGFPQERADDFNKTIKYALRCACLLDNKSNVQLNLLTLPASTELYRELGQDSLADLDPSVFTNIVLSWRITNSRREWNLINRHKSFFPAFFMIKSDHFEIHRLFKMNLIWAFLLQHLPLTARAILDLSSFTPVKLADKMISYFEKAGLKRWGLFWTKNSYRLKYLQLVRKYIKSIIKKEFQAPLLTVFEHEASIVKTIILSREKRVGGSLPKTIARCPKLSNRVLIKKYEYDLNEAVSLTQKGMKIKSPAKARTVVAYVPRGYSACAIQLSALAQFLIKLCDGKSTVREIARKVHSLIGEISFRQFLRACNKELKDLLEQGVLDADEK